MTDNTVSLAEKLNNNTLITPEQTLELALRELRSGKRKCNKILVIPLFSEIDAYDVGFYASNLRTHEMLALCSHMTHWFNCTIDGDRNR